jgi:hypothetical protein
VFRRWISSAKANGTSDGFVAPGALIAATADRAEFGARITGAPTAASANKLRLLTTPDRWD